MPPLLKEVLIDRLRHRIEVDANGCHVWTGPCVKAGYGRSWDGEKLWVSHRLFYRLLVGEIPDGMTLDHLCRNRACCNPAHLECVTRKENILRGEAPSAQHARQTHCKHGHPFAGANLYVSPRGRRRCRTCDTNYRAVRS